MSKKRPRSSSSFENSAVVDVWLRQLGELSSRNFTNRRAASEDIVLRYDIYKKLEKHEGCVNTVSFNSTGDILVSGSDDKHIILWDWQTGKVKLSFYSGHTSNVFHAKIMPNTDDRRMVTCAADGKVRHAQILESGQVKTSFLARHTGRAHKLAVEPGSPHILYTCGEDGLVQHIDLRTRTATKLFTCLPIGDKRGYMSVIGLNAITIDPRNPNLFAVAGSDEFTRLYDIRKYQWNGSNDFGQPADYFCPLHLIGDKDVGITGLAFSDQSELLVSYNDECIYLFTQEMSLGPDPIPVNSKSTDKDTSKVSASSSNAGVGEKVTPQVYKGHKNVETVKGVNFCGPKCNYVVSGSDCGRIFIWKKKSGELIRVMEADKDVVNCVESHPHTAVLASSGIEDDIKIWTPKAVEKATLPANIEEVRPRTRAWMYTISPPEDLLMQLFSWRRRRIESENEGDDVASSASGREIMEFILNFNGDDNGSSDDNDNLSGPEDPFN